MKIAVDCRMHNSSGIGTYLQGILPYLLKQKQHTFLLIGNKEVLNIYSRKRVSIQHSRIPIFSIKELFFFPAKDINKCDVFLTPNFNIPSRIKIPVYSFIHDVVFLDIKSLTSKLGYFIRKYYLERAFKISETLFTVSYFSKSRIEYHLKKRKKIIVAYGSIKDGLKNYEKKSTTEDTNSGYVLFVGNIKKHKGIGTLILGWELAVSKGFNKMLFIVGEKEGFKTNDKDVFEISNPRIKFLGKISDEEMYSYMFNAFALIQPSEYEGFGLPPLEALYLSTTCILSDIPVFNEIYSDFKNCEFFEMGNSISLCNKLISVNSKKIDQKLLIEDRYSFKTTTNLILKELEKKW